MKTLPITFTAGNAAKVRRSVNPKVQTRRVLKPQPGGEGQSRLPWSVGDRLYVREPWAKLSDLRTTDPGTEALAAGAFYRADHPTGLWHDDGAPLKWRPAMYMPRVVSRTILEVTAVKIERLADISEEDAIAEGVERERLPTANPNNVLFSGFFRGAAHEVKGTPKVYVTAAEAFRSLWDWLYRKQPEKQWSASPWVTATTFRLIPAP